MVTTDLMKKLLIRTGFMKQSGFYGVMYVYIYVCASEFAYNRMLNIYIFFIVGGKVVIIVVSFSTQNY